MTAFVTLVGSLVTVRTFYSRFGSATTAETPPHVIVFSITAARRSTRQQEASNSEQVGHGEKRLVPAPLKEELTGTTVGIPGLLCLVVAHVRRITHVVVKQGHVRHACWLTYLTARHLAQKRWR